MVWKGLQPMRILRLHDWKEKYNLYCSLDAKVYVRFDSFFFFSKAIIMCFWPLSWKWKCRYVKKQESWNNQRVTKIQPAGHMQISWLISIYWLSQTQNNLINLLNMLDCFSHSRLMPLAVYNCHYIQSCSGD